MMVKLSADAEALLERFNGTNLRGAFRNGYQDRMAGTVREDCPYTSVRNRRGGATFGLAFRRAWLAGWEQADAEEGRRRGDHQL